MSWHSHPTRGVHLGERKMAARLREGVGEWKGHQKGALGQGKVTHVLLLERGAWLRRGEGATNKRGAP